MRGDEHELLALLSGSLPLSFHRREVIVPPGVSLVLDGPEWTDGMIVVERGAVEVAMPDGTTARFAAGAVLAFARARPPTVCACDGEPVVLAVVSRRGDP